MNVYGVIMAGGGGTRFWPLSRQSRPKQLLNLSGKELMINETIDRISSVIPKKDIFIVTNSLQYNEMCKATTNRIKPEHILEEPMGRNTTACIGYAAIKILKEYGDGVMCIFPSDHYIKDEIGFSKTLEMAVDEAVTRDVLVTIGITPTYPATGYGYIRHIDEPNAGDDGNCIHGKSTNGAIKKVLEFKEKPDEKTAQMYIESGEYSWNSGMFIWKASVILNEIKKFLPDIYRKLMQMYEKFETDEEKETISKIYPTIESISIDYGIMEKSKNVEVIPADFGWNDVGSFDNLDAMYDKDEDDNIIKGDFIGIDSTDCVILSKDKLIATIGMKDVVIVESEDAILVCDKSRAQDVKKIVDILEKKEYYKYI